ncbi:synaptic glyco protein SC2 [Rhizodiscina lignyota]|uniref:Synaptic glyco protein SC2 n=1 Tax=Rhizodiscina lignyota TaxID=1504668 RepID=A0A9P4I513_9PEZI|nr:synaptic glyco protein SC2 [Rhizodiscina lignyota]
MALDSVTLQVKPRGKPIKRLPKEAYLSSSSTTEELYKKLSGAAGCSIYRLRVTNASDGSFIPNSKDTTIEAAGCKDGGVVNVKDLGPQIDWRTVFVIEYAGPLIIHPLIFYIAYPYIYPHTSSFSISSLLPSSSHRPPPPSSLQHLSMVLVLLHFVKRELETLFVHKFSSATMPVFNIFKNSGHYWGLSGLVLAYFTCAPFARISTPNLEASPVNNVFTYFGLLLFVLGELLNFNTHLSLSSLRPRDNPTKRAVPKGLGFDWVTCPNYLFEVLAWVGIWMVNRNWSTGLFLLVAIVQMFFWAKKKERRLRKEFPGEYKKKRYTIVPGLF